MKVISEIAKSYLPDKEEPKLIHAIQDVFVLNYLQEPLMSDEVLCPICGGSKGYDCLIDPKASSKRMWFCVEPDCLALVRRSCLKHSPSTASKKRSIEWPLFCEMNDLGDKMHDISFDKIKQSSEKIEYLLKFAKNPSGIILMQGEPGTGKSYCSLGVCEFFTRTNSSCMFITQTKMTSKWLSDEKMQFVSALENVPLLVIDDFGTGEIPPGFMKFFLDLINSRLQWKERGTIVTTNLNDKVFSNFCGQALSDRINTGQKFQFKEKSRRQQTIF